MSTAVRTLDQMQDALDKDLSWRKKEVGTFKVVSEKVKKMEYAFTRAGVTLLYAHWEGFVKKSAEIYLEYVSNQGLKYEDLTTCFVVFGFKKELDTLVTSKKSNPNIEAIELIRGSLGEVAILNLSGAINTESNLSSTVFENIASSVGVSLEPYKTKIEIIDEKLIKRRNQIAHGNSFALKSEEFSELVEKVLHLMDLFKEDLLNAAEKEAYKKTA